MKNNKKEIFNSLTAALYWYQYGFKVIPILPGSKKPAVKWDPWLKNLSVREIHSHWTAHPEHEVGCILGSDLIMFETNNLEYEHALTIDEEYLDLKPKLVVKTAKGVQHYFRCAPGIMLLSTYPIYFTDKIPVGVHIKTYGDLIILPPSTGKSISILEAENKDGLSVVSQEFIDEIYKLNGMISPSEYGNYDKLKPCESDYEIEVEGCGVTIKLDCDAGDVDCNECPVRPGFISLQYIRW